MRTRWRASKEEGLTLIEVLITVVILGLTFVAILGAMSTAILGSSLHRKQARAQSIVRSYGEAVKEITYLACQPSGDPTDASLPAADPDYRPPGFDFQGLSAIPSASPPNVKYWHPDEFDTRTGTFEENCPDLDLDGRFDDDSGLQLVSLAVTTDDGVTESIDVGKRVKVGTDLP